MTPEMLLALVQARGAQLDGVSGGGRPEWTLVECAFGCAGLSESRMAAFWWRYARDPTSRAIVTQVLSEEAQWIKRREHWPDKVAGLPYLTELVEVVVAEEHMSELQRHRLLLGPGGQQSCSLPAAMAQPRGRDQFADDQPRAGPAAEESERRAGCSGHRCQHDGRVNPD